MIAAARIAIAVGAELRAMRKAAGMTQAQVAQLLGSHREVVCRLERGLHMPSFAAINLIAAVTGGCLYDVWRAVDRAAALPPAPRRQRVSARASRTTELVA